MSEEFNEDDYDFEETFPEQDGWCMCDYCLEYKEYETMTSVSKEHGEEEFCIVCIDCLEDFKEEEPNYEIYEG